jgi:hypothetical protein
MIQQEDKGKFGKYHVADGAIVVYHIKSKIERLIKPRPNESEDAFFERGIQELKPFLAED